MTTYLLAWNPKKWTWPKEQLSALILKVHERKHADDWWSCGNRRHLPQSSRFFLIRLGEEPRGIVGSGHTLTDPGLREHWDPEASGPSISVQVRFDALAEFPLVTWPELKAPPFDSFGWGIQASGVAIPSEVAAALEKVWARRAGGEDPVLPDELPGTATFPEGAKRKVTINAYERDPQARAACLAHFGYDCAVCGVNMAERYGPRANGFIHVHHITPISKLPANYRVNPRKDLVPVCPNCHAVIHLGSGPPLSIAKARRLVRRE